MTRPDFESVRSLGVLAIYWRRSLLVTAAVAPVGFVALVLLSPWNSPREAGAQLGFQQIGVTTQSAKFLCGTALPGAMRVAPGDYETAINVHNFTPNTICIYKKAVEAWQEYEPPPPPSSWMEVMLEPDHALEIDCEDIRSLLRYLPGGPGSFIKGFLVIGYDAPEPLVDVEAVYTGMDMAPGGSGRAWTLSGSRRTYRRCRHRWHPSSGTPTRRSACVGP